MPGQLTLGTWNVEWLGTTEFGPIDEEKQQESVRRVLEDAGVDLWALQELTIGHVFHDLVDALPGYEAILASEVPNGSYYRGFNDTEQKVGFVYRDTFEVLDAAVVLTGCDWPFAGRPPLWARFAIPTGEPGSTELILDVAVLHMKAGSYPDSYDRRVLASGCLEGLLEDLGGDLAIVLGDFNDDVDASITQTYDHDTCEPVGDYCVSPFVNLEGFEGWTFPTRALSDAGESSLTHPAYLDLIDHHLISAPLADRLLEGSEEVLRPDLWGDPLFDGYTVYSQEVSDHYPVVTRYRTTDAP